MNANRVTLDKYLMAAFIGLLMIAAGLSSTDRGWAVIGGIILGLSLTFAAVDLYGWIRRRGSPSQAPQQEPSKLRVVLMLPVCLLLAAGLIWLAGREGIILAAVLLSAYVVLLALTFVGDGPANLVSVTTTIPITQGSEEAPEAVNSNSENAEEAAGKQLARYPVVPDSGLWRALNVLSGGRLAHSLEEAAGTTTVERTTDGLVVKREAKVDFDQLQADDVVETALSVLGGIRQQRTAAKRLPSPSDQAAEAFLARGDELRGRGLADEARSAYERAEAHAVVDHANGETSDRGLLPTVLIRLGKVEAARSLLAEWLSQTPDDEALLAAQALLDKETK
jgi:hypothetical protein